ncbi:MAG: PilZ domain-containing protein [candidate division Zixibacteria bacterium]|nr:PilZ domain-containing protein [candidate division Zixibacteria bacterium]
MNDPRLKIISDIEAGDNVESVKKPFKLYNEEKRRYIRLEISEPMDISVLKDDVDGYWPQGDGPSYNGSILNISAGGVLVISDSPVKEGMLVLLKISLQEIEVLDNIIGLVKRTDDEEGDRLIGIEFISREYLNDVFSSSEIEFLPDNVTSFNEGLKKALNKYVYYKRVSQESN